MRITRRQTKLINDIIQEQLQSALDARRKNSGRVLKEEGPDAMRVDMSIMDKKMQMAAQNEGLELADQLVFKFRQKALKAVAEVLNQHSMSYAHVDPRTLEDELSDYDTDSVMDLSQDCVMEIMDSLNKFAKSLGELAVTMAGGREAEEDL